MRQRPVGRRKRLRHSITVQRLAGDSDAFNEKDDADWGDLGQPLRAAAYPAPGTEKYANAQNAATAPFIFEVRSSPESLAILPSDRVIFNGQVHNIVALEQPESGSNIRIVTAADIGG